MAPVGRRRWWTGGKLEALAAAHLDELAALCQAVADAQGEAWSESAARLRAVARLLRAPSPTTNRVG